MKKRVGFAIGLLICAGLILYPLAANWLYEKRQDVIITDYEKKVETIGEERRKTEWVAASQYNTALLAGNRNMEEYEKRLNSMKNGIMGYLEIPSIQVTLPVYHGATEESLKKGLGHVPQTTLPVGGIGTHAGITGHTGVSDQKLFSDLNQMKKGDWFFFHVLGETLAYQVEEIFVVLPSQTEYLDPIEGKDCITLITCTPFGINDHRLLVRGARSVYTAQNEETVEDTTKPVVESTWLKEYLCAVSVGIFVFVSFLSGYAMLVWWRQDKKRRNRIYKGRKMRRKYLMVKKKCGCDG